MGQPDPLPLQHGVRVPLLAEACWWGVHIILCYKLGCQLPELLCLQLLACWVGAGLRCAQEGGCRCCVGI